MKEKRVFLRAFGFNEFKHIDFPRKMSNVKISRMEYGEQQGCSYCFPHGYETFNATISKNWKSWKFYRKKQYKE